MMHKPAFSRAASIAFLCSIGLIASCDKGSSGAKEPIELHLFNWSSYIDPTVIEEFQHETGVRIVEATYPSAEVMETTMLAGHSQYDLVVTSDVPLEGLRQVGVFRQIDRDALKNWSNLDTAVLAQLAVSDPDNRFAVPYLWGVTGMAINRSSLKKLSLDLKTDSWGLIFDPSLARQIAKCRIGIVDSPGDIFDSMLLYLGKDPNTTSDGDLNLAAEGLMKVRDSIAKISTDDQMDDMASGGACVQITWTSSVVQARRQTSSAGGQSDIAFVIPREGAMIYIDAIAIPADSSHPLEALAFIDFLMRPDIAAKNANFVGGASPNRAAKALVEPALRDDPAIHPSAAVIASLSQFRRLPAERARIVTRSWTRFRSGT